MSTRSPAAAPFGAHDYEISFSPLEAPREVSIRSAASVPLQIGDRYTVGRRGFLYDLIVEDVSHFGGGQWSARCCVDHRVWL